MESNALKRLQMFCWKQIGASKVWSEMDRRILFLRFTRPDNDTKVERSSLFKSQLSKMTSKPKWKVQNEWIEGIPH